MKITGIIAEYNPFHNGHLYQLEKAKKLTGANFIIIVMSGDFVQRGIPACLSKIQRTKMALACGADLVLELPVRYATSSAEYFARGAIGILEHLNTDYICFGSESGDLKLLSHIAHFIQKDCDDFNKQLSYYVSCGDSYPKARKKAISLCLNNNITKNNLSLLDTPNNILAIEYLKALFYYRSNISPITIKRIHSNYHEPALHTSKQNIFSINSATAIRNTILKTGNISDVFNSMPIEAYHIMNNSSAPTPFITENDLSELLFYKLLYTPLEELSSYMDLSKDMAHTIKNNLNSYQSFSQFVQSIKSRQLTYTRINRALLHLILHIKTFSLKGLSAQEIIPYIRVLGFKKQAAGILKNAKNKEIPVITKLANARKILDNNTYKILSEDLFASSLYQQLLYSKTTAKIPNEYLSTPIIL